MEFLKESMGESASFIRRAKINFLYVLVMGKRSWSKETY